MKKDTLMFLVVIGFLAYTFGVPNLIPNTGFDAEQVQKFQHSAQTYILESHESKWGIDDDDVSCACGGDGYIEHSDGHRTPCPCPGECKCKSSSGE